MSISYCNQIKSLFMSLHSITDHHHRILELAYHLSQNQETFDCLEKNDSAPFIASMSRLFGILHGSRMSKSDCFPDFENVTFDHIKSARYWNDVFWKYHQRQKIADSSFVSTWMGWLWQTAVLNASSIYLTW